MLNEELVYAMALHRVKGIGDINAKKLIAHFGSGHKCEKINRTFWFR